MKYWFLVIIALTYVISHLVVDLFGIRSGLHVFARTPYKNGLTFGLLILLAAFMIVFIRLPPLQILIASRYVIIMSLSAVIGIISFVNGALSGSPAIYLLGDTAYRFIGILLFFIAFGYYMRISNEVIKRQVQYILIICAVTYSVLFPFDVVQPPPVQVLLLVGAAICLIDFRLHPILALFLTFFLATNLPNLGRAALGVFFLALLLLTFRQGRAVRGVVGVLFGLFIMVVSYQFLDMEGTQLERRLNEMLNLIYRPDLLENQIATYVRIFEAQQVLASISESGAFRWLFGFGAGAVMDMTRTVDDSTITAALLGGEQMHNIHFHIFSDLYREGLIGLVLLCCLIGTCFFRCIITIYGSSRTAGILLILYLYPICVLGNSAFASNHFYTDMIFYFFLGCQAARSDAVRQWSSRQDHLLPVGRSRSRVYASAR